MGRNGALAILRAEECIVRTALDAILEVEAWRVRSMLYGSM